MKLICEALRNNHHIQSLNIAFNPVSAKDKLKELGSFIRQNASLQHLDLSGVLQTSVQVRRVVKKLKKSRALIAVHLSHTPCIKMDLALQLYIVKKLDARNKIIPADKIEENTIKKWQNYNDPAEIAAKVNWKYKYELIHRAKTQQRDQLYYDHLRVPVPYASNRKYNFVVQRCIAHNEIAGSTRWTINDECYACSRWQYTMIFVGKERPRQVAG